MPIKLVGGRRQRGLVGAYINLYIHFMGGGAPAREGKTGAEAGAEAEAEAEAEARVTYVLD